MGRRLRKFLSKWPRDKFTKPLAHLHVLFGKIMPLTGQFLAAAAGLVATAGRKFSGLSLRARGRIALAISIAFAGQLGAVWVLSMAREHARDRVAFERSQALHQVSAELLAKMSNADVNLTAYRTFKASAPQLLARLSSLAGGRTEESQWLPSVRRDVDQLTTGLSRVESSPVPGIPSLDPTEEGAITNRAIARASVDLARLDSAQQDEMLRQIYGTWGLGWLKHVIGVEIILAFIAAWMAMKLFMESTSSPQPWAARTSDRVAAGLHGTQLNAAYEKLKAEVMGLVQSQNIAAAETIVRRIAERTSFAMYVKKASGEYLFTNSAFNARIRPSSTTNGKTDHDLFAKTVAEALWRSDLKALQPGIPLAMEEICLDAQRRDTYLSLRFPLCYGDGNPYAVCGILIDTSGQPNSAQIRLHDVHVLRSVLDSMSDGVVVLDANATCVFANRETESIFGKEVASTPLNEWVAQFGLSSDGSAPCTTEDLPLVQALQGTVVQHVDIHVNRSSEARWLSVSATPIRDESGEIRGIVGVFNDVTERRKTENALKHAKEDAERANRAKSEFLSRMSHELRTPLNAILGFAQLLEMGRLSERHQDSVEQILKAGRHLLELINEVLDVARIESGRLSISIERVAPLEAVQETVTLVESQASKEKIQLYIEAGPAWRSHILTDRQRFKQIILNLISNAVKYNRRGGSVSISAEARDTHLRLSVTDNGPGIAKEKLALLFSPFERLGAERGAVEGTGIGLALSKGLVEAMSGRIGVDSELGNGTTFWIELPIAEGNSPKDSAAPKADLERLNTSVVADGQTVVVLYIEDNESNFHLIERTLADRTDIRLVAGKLGASAVPLAEETRPHLILLDMHLPDMEGHQVLENLRNNPQTAKIPVVVVSADVTPRQMERMLDAGAAAYLTKPLDIQKLLDAVDGAMRLGSPHDIHA
jgi:signal transduction histidine kinase/ActR/RegA family two-component response regulator